MKCIWRIILAVVTAGISEVLRHKDHDKSNVCPDFPYRNYDIIACSHLSLGDKILYRGDLMILDEINYDADTCKFVGVDNKMVVLNSGAFVLRVKNNCYEN